MLQRLWRLSAVICWLLTALVVVTINAQTSPASTALTTPSNVSSKEDGLGCLPGIFLPLWPPQTNLSTGDRVARAIVYFAGLVFMFLGVSIIADRFMASIEVITSKEREVTIKKPTGETTIVMVRIWNETVSNLTLMALGSSAPEILLSVIEVIGGGFEAGALGPGTIVGSAAFNMFVIIGLCVWVIPKDEDRRIKHLRVFFITATWSLFAYIWLYLILAEISPGVIEVWESVLTLLFFPATVVTAYLADRKIFFYKFLSKKYRTQHAVIVQMEGDSSVEMQDKVNHIDHSTLTGLSIKETEELEEFERHRQEYMEIIKDLRKRNPNADMKEIEDMAQYEVINKGPKSRAFYRIQATRKLTGAGNVMKKAKLDKHLDVRDVEVILDEDDNITRVFFDPGHYTVMENVGDMTLTVTRTGGNLNNTIYVDYRTEDGTANSGSDFDHSEGTLVFHPGETHKQFHIHIIDDDIFEEDEHFYIRLSNLRVGDMDGMFQSNHSGLPTAKIDNPAFATVMILDDDHSGIFSMEQTDVHVVESMGQMHLKITRHSGARGQVKIPFLTLDNTARRGRDYDYEVGEVVFENDQTEAYITIGIVDDEEYEKDELFYVELCEPKLLKRKDSAFKRVSNKKIENPERALNKFIRYMSKSQDGLLGEPEEEEVEGPSKPLEEMTEQERIAELGKPRLGEKMRCAVRIRESKEFKNTVDKLIKKANTSLLLGTSSWREQFIDAITVSPGDDDGDDEDDEDAEEKLPSCCDYVMHFLTIFWKVAFAFVPPTDYWGGWACFWFSIIVIGVLTGFIGDLASHFGCTIGLKDTVTAISFVALGTSVPDTFASKVAAVGDKYADSSIGNVTGSNAVNVFLGIGLAWTVASVYHEIKGGTFRVTVGSLAFSVTIFCLFACICIMVLVIRRNPKLGGAELGGPKKFRYPTAFLFFTLWVLYLLISSLEAYGHIEGF